MLIKGLKSQRSISVRIGRIVQRIRVLSSQRVLAARIEHNFMPIISAVMLPINMKLKLQYSLER